MSELKRMLPQLRLACLLTAMMLVTTAGRDLGSFYLVNFEPDCEPPPDPVDFRIVPPLLSLKAGETKQMVAELRDPGQTVDWSLGFFNPKPKQTKNVYDSEVRDDYGERMHNPLFWFGEMTMELVPESKKPNSVDLEVSFRAFPDVSAVLFSFPEDLWFTVNATFPKGAQRKSAQIVPAAPHIAFLTVQERLVYDNRETTVRLQVENVANTESCTWDLATKDAEDCKPKQALEPKDLCFEQNTGPLAVIKIRGSSPSGCRKEDDFIKNFLVTCADVKFTGWAFFYNICSSSDEEEGAP